MRQLMRLQPIQKVGIVVWKAVWWRWFLKWSTSPQWSSLCPCCPSSPSTKSSSPSSSSSWTSPERAKNNPTPSLPLNMLLLMICDKFCTYKLSRTSYQQKTLLIFSIMQMKSGRSSMPKEQKSSHRLTSSTLTIHVRRYSTLAIHASTQSTLSIHVIVESDVIRHYLSMD